MAYQTVNPYTNELIKTFSDASDADVSQAIDAAHALADSGCAVCGVYRAWRVV